MSTKDIYENVSFKIITHSGMAKSMAIEAMRIAREGKYKEAEKLIEDARENLKIASHTHMDIVVKEANGEQLPFSVLFMHSEDQLLTSQTLVDMAVEIIELTKMVKKQN